MNKKQTADVEQMLRQKYQIEHIAMIAKCRMDEVMKVRTELFGTTHKSTDMLPKMRVAFPGTPFTEWLDKAQDAFNRFFRHIEITPIGFIQENSDKLRELYMSGKFPYNSVLQIVQQKY